MRTWLLIFCLLFSACGPTAAETSGRGSGAPTDGLIQALYFISKSQEACLQHELTTTFDDLRLYATPYFGSYKGAVAPGRIAEIRLPAGIARGGNDSVRFVDGGRLISFDPVRKTMLFAVTRGRLIRLSFDGGFRETAAADISELSEREILWWETDEADLRKIASHIDRTVDDSWTAAERAGRMLLGVSKSRHGLTLLEEDTATTFLYVTQSGTTKPSQYHRAYWGGNHVSDGIADDPLESVEQVRWAPVSRATADPRCPASKDLRSARTLDIGTDERPLFVDLIGSPDTAKRIMVYFSGGPSGWNRRPQDIQYIAPLLADPEVAIAGVAYSGSSGSGLATFNRLRAETVSRAVDQDAAAVASWLKDKPGSVLIVGASFGSAFATSLAAKMSVAEDRCVRLALVVPLVAHTDATYASFGDRAPYQRTFERAMLGPDLSASWRQYNEISKHSLDAASRPATTFMIAEHDVLIRKEDVLSFVRPDRDAVVQLAGTHAVAGGDPKISAALEAAFSTCSH